MKADVLIIGTGLAGLTAALELADQKVNVTLLTRDNSINDCNSNLAQGGIIYKGKKDSPQKLYRDIIKAGASLSNPEAVKFLSEHGSKAVLKILINKLNVNFSRDDKNQLVLIKEGAHSSNRIIHSKDKTGEAILDKYIEHVKNNKRINILTNHTAIDLITLSHHSTNPIDRYHPITCCGAYVFNRKTSKVKPIFAKQVILATGGLGHIYQHTSNNDGARGDGIAMAFRAGARIINLEYIQFHPTTFYHQASKRFLISEALRGSGAKLIDHKGKRFMDKYHELAELAPRDIVARAIHNEMIRSKASNVFLDISFKDADWVRKRFPSIYAQCMKFKIDITKEPIPVVPAAHYSCGGVYTDMYGTTTVERLKAVGEVACTGLHGANRLASTSLLECLVMGKSCAKNIIKEIKTGVYYFPHADQWFYEKEEIDQALVEQDWLTIQQTMWNYAGLVRTKKHLNRAKKLLEEINDEIERFYNHTKLSDSLIGLRNASYVALLILRAATLNKKSCGCHYRID
ncbi:MAG: L-aspartate oxidase [Pseudomonadota bacterium]